MRPIKAVLIKVPRELYDEFKAAATEDGRTFHAHMLWVMREHLRLRKRRESRRKGDADE
jgi:hypothetical protein